MPMWLSYMRVDTIDGNGITYEHQWHCLKYHIWVVLAMICKQDGRHGCRERFTRPLKISQNVGILAAHFFSLLEHVRILVQDQACMGNKCGNCNAALVICKVAKLRKC